MIVKSTSSREAATAAATEEEEETIKAQTVQQKAEKCRRTANILEE